MFGAQIELNQALFTENKPVRAGLFFLSRSFLWHAGIVQESALFLQGLMREKQPRPAWAGAGFLFHFYFDLLRSGILSFGNGQLQNALAKRSLDA